MTDALQRLVAALIFQVAMDRLLDLLPTASLELIPEPTSRAEDLAIQNALDEVLEYHRTHRPKNTTKNYEPKQKEWKVGSSK